MAETRGIVDRLRAKRGGHRGVRTNLTEETEEIVHATVIDYHKCEVIRALLDEEKSKNGVVKEILGICKVANIGAEVEESTKVMSRILNAKRKLDKAKLNTRDTEGRTVQWRRLRTKMRRIKVEIQQRQVKTRAKLRIPKAEMIK